MTTIAGLQRKLKTFDAFAREATNSTAPAKATTDIQAKWQDLFSDSLSNASARSFVDYYRNMRTTRKQSGGMAPLTYEMTPGANVSVYGRFPVEVGTDMGSIRDLDVFFRDSLSAGCGTENSSLTVPVEMGSNKVGGKRNSRKLHNSRKQHKSRKLRKNNLRSARKTRAGRRAARHYGGAWALSDALPDYRPYWATAPPNPLQAGMASYQGITPPISAPSSPVDHTWKYMSDGSTGLIDPGQVANIKSSLSALANPAPWQKM